MTVAEALQHAFAALQRGDWHTTSSLCKSVLEVQPHNLHALYYLGFVALRTGRPADAVELLRDVCLAQASNAEVHNNYGLALAGLGRHDDALASYERALALTPGY